MSHWTKQNFKCADVKFSINDALKMIQHIPDDLDEHELTVENKEKVESYKGYVRASIYYLNEALQNLDELKKLKRK